MTNPETITNREPVEKWCSACQRKHPIEEFGANRSEPGGKHRICREVARQQERALRTRRTQRIAEIQLQNARYAQRDAQQRRGRNLENDLLGITAQEIREKESRECENHN